MTRRIVRSVTLSAALAALVACAPPGSGLDSRRPAFSSPSPAQGPVRQATRFVALYERLCLRATPNEAAADAQRLGFYRADANEAAVFLHRDAAPGSAVLIRGGTEVSVLTLQTVPSLGRAAREQQCILGTPLTEEQARAPFLDLMQRLAGEGLAVGSPQRLDLPGASSRSLNVSVNGPAPRSRLAKLAPQTNPGNIIRTLLMVVE